MGPLASVRQAPTVIGIQASLTGRKQHPMPPEQALGGECLIKVLCRIDDNGGDRLGLSIGGKHTGCFQPQPLRQR
jgi:hypothetical protein